MKMIRIRKEDNYMKWNMKKNIIAKHNTVPLLLLITLMLVGCTVYTPPDADVQKIASNIIVTPGDVKQKYEILGTIQWPEVDTIMVFKTPGDPARLREEAYKRWGTSANAIIGYITWQDGEQTCCSGTAVHFIKE